ncbi:hypothetical protein [Sphingomonas sp. PAMC 26605]|uniref:hypothetical protein n=1 Tax=Sphingomonas sp. PAMC 26605 TaxID=1112214 RepID=UPI000311E23F|nr:hypothetical protein [Sphingomonas sp. PAMC 26605]
MATASPPSIDELNRTSERLEAEARKLRAEAAKLSAEEAKLSAERLKLLAETEILPRNMVFQAMIAFAAILGAGAALAKLFFP